VVKIRLPRNLRDPPLFLSPVASDELNDGAWSPSHSALATSLGDATTMMAWTSVSTTARGSLSSPSRSPPTKRRRRLPSASSMASRYSVRTAGLVAAGKNTAAGAPPPARANPLYLRLFWLSTDSFAAERSLFGFGN